MPRPSLSATPAAAPTPSPAASPTGAATSATPSATPLVPAGLVPPDVTIDFAGIVSPDFANARIVDGVARVASLQHGASVKLAGGLTLSRALRPGDIIEAAARIHIDGHGSFADVDGTTFVHLSVEMLGELVPTVLLYSDDPERIPADASGVLSHATIGSDDAVRLYTYHVAAGTGTRLFLVLRTSGAARTQVLGSAAGPSDEYGYVGHVSTLQYLLEHASQESVIEPVASDAPFIMELGAGAMSAKELIAAIFDLRVLDGSPVDLDLVATDDESEVNAALAAGELPGDGHHRSGKYSLVDIPPLALSYAAGGPEPNPVPIGAPGLPNPDPDGRTLGGDYGVLRDVLLNLSNPTAAAQDVYFYESPAGGSATATIWFTGDPQPTEIPCVYREGTRYEIRRFTLAPGATVAVTGEFMTDGASSFPLLFGLTATPPSPLPGPYSPDACNPRTAPPSPAASATPPVLPSPLPSATPSA